jgi:hypothetical protein
VGLVAVVAFAVLGGTSFAGEAAKKPKPAKAQYGQYNNAARTAGPKVTLCHKGKVTIRVGAPAVKAHTAHGDEVGACATTSAASMSKAKKGKKAGDTTTEATTSAGSGPGNGKAKGKHK